MPNINKILVAFDGSKDSLKALRLAKKMAQNNDAHLTILHTYEGPVEQPVYVTTTPEGDQFMMQHMTGQGLMQKSEPPSKRVIIQNEIPNVVMMHAKSEVSDLDNVKFEKVVGKPGKEIVDYAHVNAIDVIVIGNRGIGAFKKLVMGSVSETVVRDAACSVMVVR